MKNIATTVGLGLALAGTAHAQEVKQTPFEYNVGSRVEHGVLGARIAVEKDIYKPGDTLRYHLDVFATDINSQQPVLMNGYNVNVILTPAGTLQNTNDDRLIRQFTQTYDAPASLRELEYDTTIPLPISVPGRYALYTTGTVTGPIVGGTHRIDTGSYDTFTIEGVAREAPPQNIWDMYADEQWHIHAGRYGANHEFPRDGRADGVTTVKEGNVLIDRASLSHNFELKVLQGDRCEGCDSKARTKRTAPEYAEALYVVHGIAEQNPDLDGDINLCSSVGTVMQLEFRQAYEVKQHAEGSGTGRAIDRADITFATPTVTEFAGVQWPIDRSDSMYLVKVAFDDTNGNGSLDNGENVLGLDALSLEIHNKAPNAWAAYVAGAATGLVVGAAIPREEGHGIHWPTVPEVPEEGSFESGNQGNTVE